jgi:hypothetical protein
MSERKDGLHRGVAFDEYASWPAINHSTLEHFKRTPAHARDAMVRCGDRESEALRKGWAVHVAVLEPDRFAAEFVAAPKLDRRTKDGKAAWAEFQAAAAGMLVLTEEEMALCLEMRRSVWAHPTASALLSGEGVNEASLLWTDRTTGERCKGRLDRLTSLNSRPLIVDLKTAEDASRKAFERSVYNFGYHRQAAMYLDGADRLAPHERSFVWIVVEKAPPWCVAVYEIEEAALSIGQDEWRKHLRTYADCKARNEWPGYDVGVDYCGLPAWAYRGIEG